MCVCVCVYGRDRCNDDVLKWKTNLEVIHDPIKFLGQRHVYLAQVEQETQN